VAGKWLCIRTKYTFTCIITSVLQHHVMKACMLCAPLLVGYTTGWPLDLVWTWLQRERERERERERDICPHLNMNLNRTFSMWPVLIMTSDCTMPGHEEQVTNFAFHEHFSFFFRY